MRKALPRSLLVTLVLLIGLAGEIGSARADLVAESTTYYHNDFSGSPIAATNEAGALLWQTDYMPYGKKYGADAASTSNKVWYTGHVEDSETGLVYMEARYYDPDIGRFMGIDPVGFVEGSPQSFNRFAYANNNPYRFVDPDGRLSVQATKFSDNQYLFAFNFAPNALLGTVREVFTPFSPLKWVNRAEKGCSLVGIGMCNSGPVGVSEIMNPFEQYRALKHDKELEKIFRDSGYKPGSANTGSRLTEDQANDMIEKFKDALPKEVSNDYKIKDLIERAKKRHYSTAGADAVNK